MSRHHAAPSQRVSMNHVAAIDVKRLSSSNLAEKDEQDRQHSLQHDEHPSQLSYNSASVAADDSYDTTASTFGDDSKGEVRRRRRTRPDEANMLVEAYLDNAFPDHETRLALANQVGMSVRAVSVWFQNRRQAEKKRSGRYSGGGHKPDFDSRPADESLVLSSSEPANQQSIQRTPFGNATENGAPVATRPDHVVTDFTNDNKENIPPDVRPRATSQIPVQEHIAQLKRTSSFVKEASSAVAMPLSTSRDLRTMVGPDGAGLDGLAPAPTPALAKSSMTRHRSAPRFSLDQVLGARTDSMRRANTTSEPLKSSDIEHEDLDTILPPRKIISRASSMSLLTTAGGRASLGNFTAPSNPASVTASASKTESRSLNSRLPAVLTAALQRQGIIAVNADAPLKGETRQVLLEKMPDSSVSSSDFDMRSTQEDERAGCDEDEERTLKLIAQRRAAKAHAALINAQAKARKHAREESTEPAPATEAREALSQARLNYPASKGLSLDWAAGRDRASTTAMPHSVAGTPFSRSLSASQLSQYDDAQLPALTSSLNSKRAPAPLRSVSATDLTKRLQDARKKSLSVSAARKRSSKSMHVVNDENVDPHGMVEESPKRRKHPHEMERDAAVLNSNADVWLTDAGQMRAPLSDSSPFLSRRPLVPHPSFSSDNVPRIPSGVPSTPSSASLYTSSVPLSLSTRSDRYRAIGASPAGSLGRSISANYHIGRGLPHSRESSAREQQGRTWDAIRPASHDFSSSTSRAGLEDSWAAPTSFSQPLSMTASTPSRVLTADRSTIASTPRSTSRSHVSLPFAHEHDDSGFFGDSASEDEDHQPLRKRGLPDSEFISPRKASLRSSAKDAHFAVPHRAAVSNTNREGDDHHAAQLLLGLGKSVGSREGSSQ